MPVYADFETASIGRNQSYAFDFRFKIRKQIVRQANGLVSVVSNRAINDLYFHHHRAISYSQIVQKLYCFLYKTVPQVLRIIGIPVMEEKIWWYWAGQRRNSKL